MRTRNWLVLLVPLALFVGYLAGGPPDARAQDRSRYEREPVWAKALLEAIKTETATKPRYEHHRRGEATVVFDTQTGITYSFANEKQVRIEDPIAGRVVLRRAETIDQTIGGVIRAR